ncbi:MAG: TetR/AcrR family transcriptional regulator [Alphaproteobacteria bacterium]|nr:TetR/AcrR family transcriptional regulator [Alphaproteobacteria bacterium]MDB5723231.1 TetR/AcrR family transcriptional regulator [Alphaproteobacteria bacterium]
MASVLNRDSLKRRSAVTTVTRIKIMEAAERLFAERGIDGVAFREIAIAANQANNTAVQYHFGSKESLVYEIFKYRTNLFEAQRSAMLERAERAGRLLDARALLEILCLPHLSIADEAGAHPYSAFFAQYLTRARSENIRHPYDDPEVLMPALRRVRRLIAERVHYVPPHLLRLRVSLCKLMFVNMLMRRDSGFPRLDEDISLPQLVDDTLVQMTAALTAPHDDGARLFSDIVANGTVIPEPSSGDTI